MLRRRSHPDASVSTRRAEAYTDGVFAIAATLLVLDLTGRSLSGADSDAELATALAGMWQPLMTFVITFLILSLMWMTHVAQFEHIRRLDDVGLWINNVRLLFIVLVPFTSSLTTDYSEYLLGRVLLPIDFFVVVLCSWAQWAWAMRHRAEAIPDLGAAEAGRQGAGALSALLVSAVVVALSPWAGSFAFLLFFLDGALTRALSGPAARAAERAASS